MIAGALASVAYAGVMASAPASAEAGPTVLVPPLRIEGDVASGWHASFSEGLRRGLGRMDAVIVEGESEACPSDDDACWMRVGADVGADFFVRASAAKRASDYTFTLVLYTVGSAQEVARTTQACELCGLVDAGVLLEDTAGTLAARMHALADAKTVVSFESSPPGARLRLDGREVGTTPLSRELEPGTHEAEVVSRGFVSQRRTFEAQPAVDQTVRFELAAEPKDDRFMRPVGWAALGLGVAAVGAGGVLIAIDEDPITSRCSGENVNAVGVCKFRRNTLAGGVALVAVGAVSIAAGVVLLVRGRTRGGRVSAQPGGIALRF